MKPLVQPAIVLIAAEVARGGMEEAAGKHYRAIVNIADAIYFQPTIAPAAVALQNCSQLFQFHAQTLRVIMAQAGGSSKCMPTFSARGPWPKALKNTPLQASIAVKSRSQ